MLGVCVSGLTLHSQPTSRPAAAEGVEEGESMLESQLLSFSQSLRSHGAHRFGQREALGWSLALLWGWC
jgi:hypothetical protein